MSDVVRPAGFDHDEDDERRWLSERYTAEGMALGEPFGDTTRRIAKAEDEVVQPDVDQPDQPAYDVWESLETRGPRDAWLEHGAKVRHPINKERGKLFGHLLTDEMIADAMMRKGL